MTRPANLIAGLVASTLLAVSASPAIASDHVEIGCGSTTVRVICTTPKNGVCVESRVEFRGLQKRPVIVAGDKYIRQAFVEPMIADQVSCYDDDFVAVDYTFQPSLAQNTKVLFFDLSGNRLAHVDARRMLKRAKHSTSLNAAVSDGAVATNLASGEVKRS